MIDESTFESRLTKMTMAQIASEWAVVRTYIVPDRLSIIEEAEVIFTRAVRLQTFLTQQFEEDNYGPRHNLRKQFANLLVWVRVTEPGTSRIIEKAKALQTQANDCGDRGMHHILKSLRLCTILEVSCALPIEHQVSATWENFWRNSPCHLIQRKNR